MFDKYDVVYGYCRRCGKWVVRNDMISTNFTVFEHGVDAKKEKHRFRLCKKCHGIQMERWLTSDSGRPLEWNNSIRNGFQIVMDERLASRCPDIEFDDTDQIAAEKLREFNSKRRRDD